VTNRPSCFAAALCNRMRHERPRAHRKISQWTLVCFEALDAQCCLRTSGCIRFAASAQPKTQHGRELAAETAE
jgi:hypothetical protein